MYNAFRCIVGEGCLLRGLKLVLIGATNPCEVFVSYTDTRVKHTGNTMATAKHIRRGLKRDFVSGANNGVTLLNITGLAF